MTITMPEFKIEKQNGRRPLCWKWK